MFAAIGYAGDAKHFLRRGDYVLHRNGGDAMRLT